MKRSPMGAQFCSVVVFDGSGTGMLTSPRCGLCAYAHLKIIGSSEVKRGQTTVCLTINVNLPSLDCLKCNQNQSDLVYLTSEMKRLYARSEFVGS